MTDHWAAPLLRRRALDLIDESIARLGDAATDRDKAVHDIRKKLKELRALADLLRNRLPRHGRRDRHLFRDAGRTLAPARDAKAALEAFDHLQKRFAAEWTPRQFVKIRRTLSQRLHAELPAQSVEVLIDALNAERRKVAAWPVDGMKQEDLWAGIRHSYRRCRRGMSAALETNEPARLHEWRKRVKTHRHQAELISVAGLSRLHLHAKSLHKLSDILGEHHDLVVVDQLLRESPDSFGTAPYVARFLVFVAQRMRELEQDAESLGRDLFGKKTKVWEERARANARRGPKRAPRQAIPASSAASRG